MAVDSFVISNQFFMCLLLGMFGGIAKVLGDAVSDIGFNIDLKILGSNAFISGFCGIAVYFVSYDVTYITPHRRVGLSLVAGYSGISFLKKLTSIISSQNLTTASKNK